MKEYSRGFEDACELAIREIQGSRDVNEANKRVLRLLGTIKESKHNELIRELGLEL